MMKRERHQLSVAVFVVLRRGEKICLIRRANTGWMDGFYSLPAGGLESGETLLNAAVREAHEETGVTIEAASTLKPKIARGWATSFSVQTGSVSLISPSLISILTCYG